jgi:predicted aspartyl protease
MGRVHAELDVRPEGGEWETVRFLVDSGATYSVLPWRTWRRLGLKANRTLEFSLVDATVIRRRVSHCFFRYRDVEAPSPVILGERHDDALLGAFTLEALGLVLDPFERKLKPMHLRLAGCMRA